MTVKELRDKLNKIDNTEILDKEIYLALGDRKIIGKLTSCVIKRDIFDADYYDAKVCFLSESDC